MKTIRTGVVVVVCVLASGLCSAALPAPAPNYDWWYGCSPTAAGMMIGYYDINGYGGLQYSNLVPGGVAELNTFNNPGAIVNSAMASPQHIADFYQTPPGYAGSNDDIAPPWHAFDCLADFMGTSQDSGNMSNGFTSFKTWADGSRYLAKDARADLTNQVIKSDGMLGLGEYVEYSGYEYANKGLANEMLYSQLTDPNGVLPFRFTFADFKAEIDAGRPVLVHIEEHTMLGYDYIDATTQILVHDTWADNDDLGPNTDGQNPGIMTWNGLYQGRPMWGVTVLELSQIPEPATLTLAALGFAALVWRRRRK